MLTFSFWSWLDPVARANLYEYTTQDMDSYDYVVWGGIPPEYSPFYGSDHDSEHDHGKKDGFYLDDRGSRATCTPWGVSEEGVRGFNSVVAFFKSHGSLYSSILSEGAGVPSLERMYSPHGFRP